MEGSNGVKESCVLRNEAHLGWIYNSNTMECSSPEVPKDYKFEEVKSYKWIFFKKSNIEKMPSEKFQFIFGNAPWFKDYQDSSAQETIRVQMMKINEKRACEDIDNASNQLVVTSLFYKAYINVILFYDIPVPESFQNDMKLVLDSIINEKEVGLTKSISNGLIKLHLYDENTVKISAKPVWILKEACRHLKGKIIEKPLTVAFSNGNVVDKLLPNDMCMDKYKCCPYQSDGIIDEQTHTLNDITELDVPSYAQITSNLIEGSTKVVTNPFNSNSGNYGSLVINSPTIKGNLIEEIITQIKIKEGNKTRELNFQTQITSKKERSGNYQTAPLKGNHSSRISVSKGKTSQPDTSDESEYATTNSKYNLRERSTSCRKRNSSCRMENQNFSANKGEDISKEKKVYQVGKMGVPKIPISLLSENSSSNVSRDDNCKKIVDVVKVKDQNSNKLVAQQENINHTYSDENSLALNDHEIQYNKDVPCNKANNVNSEIDPINAVTGTDIATNSPYQNNMGLAGSYEIGTKAIKTQSPIITDLSQATNCDNVSSGHTQNMFKILEPSKIFNDPCGMKRHYYGNISSSIEEKVILFLGASGSGKTALVNFVANYFEGVKTPDDETVIVAPTSEKTKEIIAYTFCNQKDTNTVVTVIDTPGLNDSSGSEIRDHVNSLKTFLANAASHGLKIHALGFVAQAHLGRLTSSERLVMDYVSTIFGEGVKDNIITLISFADVQESPPVVEAMKNYGIKTKHFLKFNNAVLNDSSVEVDEIDRVYWRTGYKSWKKVMKLLNDFRSLSINAMKTLQKEVYTKSFVDSSIKDLNCGLMEFFSLYEQRNHKDIRCAGNNVWDLVTIAHHHLRYTPEEYVSVESLLVTSVENMCGASQLTNSLVYLRALTYYSPRGLDKCTQAILESIYPVYVSARNIQISKRRKSNKKNKCDKNDSQINVHEQKIIYCHQCQKDHLMERFEVEGLIDSFKKTLGYKQDTLITYKCTECTCEGNVHGANPLLNSGDTANFFGSDGTEILHHTKCMLLKVVKMYSLLNSNMTVKDLLKFIGKEANSEYNIFINALIEIS